MSALTMLSEGVAMLADADQLGESVTHWPAGVEGNAATRMALVYRGQPEKNPDHGRGYLTRHKLAVETSITCLRTDVWVIDGDRFQCELVGPPNCGYRTVHVVRREEVSTMTSANTPGRGRM